MQNSLYIVNTTSKKVLTVEIKRDSRAIIKPGKLFAPKNLMFELADYTEYDTEIVVIVLLLC